ncbi:hypothetical protein Mapa_012097 [Marchantia paleacea]|nr:hypothetical protein Mapa_012097 [Marchantia paleacea]
MHHVEADCCQAIKFKKNGTIVRGNMASAAEATSTMGDKYIAITYTFLQRVRPVLHELSMHRLYNGMYEVVV